MDSIRDIRQRISSVKDIQHITRAMKMVSVAKLHRTESAVVKAVHYIRGLEEIFDFIFKKLPEFAHPFFERNEGKQLFIAVASDKGLCGGYNANVAKSAVAHLRKGGQAATMLMVVGKRAMTMCTKRGCRVEEGFFGFGEKPGSRFAENLSKKVMELFCEGKVSEVIALFNPYKRGMGGRVAAEMILPLKKPEAAERPERVNYLYEPRLDVVIDKLLRRIIACKILSILMEAQLSEHLSRMQSMESASQNATDLVEELTLIYNKARQSIITNEILDIIGGSVVYV